ncbi:MAG: hypothetical protein GDA44_02795 [Prochloron sp. SP5CPC1]|nr:hypothetical protein [Candidatus Paraprochloron terpiosi SP5CPC1]
MSGICGIINIDGKPVNVKELKQMTELLEFRGPDGTNMWINGNVGFGHTLFITASQPENQPLTLDGKVYLTADARIDATAELIPQLQTMGSRVTDQATAAELILHAYKVWGEDFLSHLLGDFAFALWDKEKQKLLCGRDHFGLRVLYYAQIRQTFVFSNVIKCLQDYPGVRKKLNDVTIGDFLLFGQGHYWLDKSITLWEDINKVPPAHFLSLDLSGNKLIKPYWHFPWDTPHLQYNDDEEVLVSFGTG